MVRLFDGEKFREILSKGEVEERDFRLMYPSQSEDALIRTARYYMRALEGLGLAVKENGKWKVRKDTLEAVAEFERLRRKFGYEGDLYQFITEVFKKTRDLLRKKTFIENLAEDYGVSETALMDFIEGFLDNVEWKTEEDLKVFLRDFKKGLWVRLSPKIHGELKRENLKELKEVREKGFTEEEALIVLLNALLEKVPLSLKLWKEVEEDSSGNGVRGWIEDRLAERGGMEGVELVPVNRTIYRKLQDETENLTESQADAIRLKLVKRLNDAVEKTLKEAKEMARRRKVKRR